MTHITNFLHNIQATRRLLRIYYKQDTVAAINIAYGLAVFASIVVAWESFNNVEVFVLAKSIQESWIVCICMLLIANGARYCFKECYSKTFRLLKLVSFTFIDMICIYAVAIALHFVYVVSSSAILECIDKFFAE